MSCPKNLDGAIKAEPRINAASAGGKNVLQFRHGALQRCQAAGALALDESFECLANQCRFFRHLNRKCKGGGQECPPYTNRLDFLAVASLLRVDVESPRCVKSSP